MNKEFFARKKDIDELQINKANASDVYTKEEVINKITEKVSEIVADAPEDFDTLKEMSDWINKHEGSAAAMNTAIQSKVDKEEGKSLISDLEIARLADVENYDDTKVKNDIAINRTTLGTQCKNMLKLSHPFGYKYTNAGGTATWTFNNDYSVSMVVNSQISSGVAIPISEVTLKKGSYVYSVEGYSTPNITHTQLYSLNVDGSWTWLANLSAIENKITVTEETTYSFRAYRNSLVTVGVTETLYPMLRSADITDDTYEPYKENIDERLIQNKSDIAVNKTTLGYQCKNLFNPNAVNWYQPTKTSIAKDGTITSTATSDSRSWSLANAEYFLTLPAGKYIVKTITESLGENSISENIRGYNESGSQVFEIYPNIVGTRITTFTIDETATIGFMFKLITQTCKIMVYDADIIGDTYEPYQPSVKEINAHIIDKTQKNLLDVINTSQDIEGVTYNVNSDKTITFSRVTAGNQSTFHLNSKNAAFMPNKYAGCLLSGCTSGSNSTYGLVAMYSNDGTNWANENWNFTSPVKILDYPYINIALIIRKNTTVSNVTVKPMICTEADYNISTEYTPYSPTNAELADRDSYSLSVSSKSTSAAISYNGVPTLICLTPNTADSTAGGLYMINSAGAVVKLIEKTGVVVAAASSSKTFTITNNTTTVMDVCISRCWGR